MNNGAGLQTAPIALIGFDRPDYFRRVLDSLFAQRPVAPDPSRIYLFQDGAINPWSREQKAEPAALAEVRAEFLRRCPEVNLHAAEENLGIAANIRRAERFLFEQLDAPVGLFFEDDLVLAPHYLEMLGRLVQLAESNGRVAYVAAFGDPQRSFAEYESRLIPLYNHWGFALFRRHWRDIDAMLAPYYRLLEGIDYAYRDNERIFDLFADMGLANSGTSQDGMKAVACARLGLARLGTRRAHAEYIGAQGAHMTPKVFRMLGYGQTAVSRKAELIDQSAFDGEVQDIIGFQEKRMRNLYQRLSELRKKFRSRPRSVHDMVLDAEAVRWVYRVMLLREIESEERLAGLVAQRITLETLVREIAASEEFQSRILKHPRT